MKNNHSKVRNIKYDKLEAQKYMRSPLFTNDEVCLLFALRTNYIECKFNFKNKYGSVDLNCPLCNQHVDNQESMLSCPVIVQKLNSIDIVTENFKYDDIYSSDTRKQKVITDVFMKIIEIRKDLLEHNLEWQVPSTSTIEGADD